MSINVYIYLYNNNIYIYIYMYDVKAYIERKESTYNMGYQ